MSKNIAAAKAPVTPAELHPAPPTAPEPFKTTTGSRNTTWSANLLNRMRGVMADMLIPGKDA